MRPLALIATLLAAGAAYLTASAGAEDTHTYTIELDNAFGIVQGSEVRIAGVNQGEVTELDINDQKRALITVELAGPLSQLGADTECSSEPQSLIAEYFIDCQPQGEPIPTEEEGSETEPNVPVEQTTQTVQADLVQSTLREPFKRRLQLLINEFGTALAGNPQNLNDAVRRGAPALRQLEQALDILGDQNTIIRDLNANSDRIIARLAERRDDVVKFIKEARDTAAASAERRADLAAEIDQRAGRDTGRTSTAPGSPNTMGYTGLEGLLNYVYYQTGALNQYDAVGHSLHISLFSVEGPCGEYSTGHEPGSEEFGVPNADDSDHTTDVTEANDCVAWLGPNQPGLSQPINVPPYDDSVCPNGSTNHEICDPGVSTDSASGGKNIQTTSEGNEVPGYQP